MAKIILRPRQNTITRLVRPRPDGNKAFVAFVSDDGFAAYVHRDVLALITRHEQFVAPDEAIGLLTGRICHDPKSGLYTIVTAAGAARGGEFKSGRGHVELLAVGHDRVRRRLEDAHPDREVVGWYHTHPQYAPVFSPVDAEEQATWNDPGHIGIVYSGTGAAEPFGVYHGPDASPLRRRTDEAPADEIDHVHDTQGEMVRVPEPPAQPVAPAPVVTHAPHPSAAYARRRRSLKDVLLFLVVLLLVCLIGSLYWLHYRVQSVEARLMNLAAEKQRNASPDNSPEPPRQAVVLPLTVATPTADTPGQAARPAPLDVPELHIPSKPLSTAVTSGTPAKTAKKQNGNPRRPERRDTPAKKTLAEKKPAKSSGRAEASKPKEKSAVPKAEATPAPPRR